MLQDGTNRQVTKYTVVSKKKNTGLVLQTTPAGLVVTGFTASYDRTAGIGLGDTLIAINSIPLRGLALPVVNRILGMTPPPR